MSTGQNAVIPAKEPVKRKRGGQPGNTDAFKHGFYTKNFSLAERRGLHSKSALAQRAVFDRASSTFIKQLSLVLEEINDENALNEP